MTAGDLIAAAAVIATSPRPSVRHIGPRFVADDQSEHHQTDHQHVVVAAADTEQQEQRIGHGEPQPEVGPAAGPGRPDRGTLQPSEQQADHGEQPQDVDGGRDVIAEHGRDDLAQQQPERAVGRRRRNPSLADLARRTRPGSADGPSVYGFEPLQHQVTLSRVRPQVAAEQRGRDDQRQPSTTGRSHVRCATRARPSRSSRPRASQATDSMISPSVESDPRPGRPDRVSATTTGTCSVRNQTGIAPTQYELTAISTAPAKPVQASTDVLRTASGSRTGVLHPSIVAERRRCRTSAPRPR